SSLTNQVAMVQYPSLRRTALRHIELVPLTDTRALVVIITNAGRVEQRMVSFPSALTEEDLVALRRVLNTELEELQLAGLPDALGRVEDGLPEELKPAARLVVQVVGETLRNEAEERV
ncbi:UNVERIFIED_CONTAM: heat-inducible transcriptional repressor HrcA, partial [Bacillus subtilis]